MLARPNEVDNSGLPCWFELLGSGKSTIQHAFYEDVSVVGTSALAPEPSYFTKWNSTIRQAIAYILLTVNF